MYDVTLLSESDLPEIKTFLDRIFEAKKDHPPFRLETLRWKAFDPHPLWPESRSYGVRYQGRLIAHGVLFPLRFITPEKELSVGAVIDWAADPELRGGGVALYMALAKRNDIHIGLGGSEMTRAVLPKMGMRVHQTVGVFERRERPFGHHLAAPPDWKTPLRIGRDLWRNLQRKQRYGAGAWSARHVKSFSAGTVPLPSPGRGVCAGRTAELLDYMLRCPAAAMEGYLLSRDQSSGYCVLSRMGTSCRIADLWVESDDEAEWGAAVAVALQLALADPQTTAVSVAGATPFVRGLLIKQGFRLVEDLPLFLRGRMPDQPVHMSLMDYDSFYLP